MIVEDALIDSGIEVQCVSGEHVWVGGHGLRGGGGGGCGGYQPGVYVPLKALFQVYFVVTLFLIYQKQNTLSLQMVFEIC